MCSYSFRSAISKGAVHCCLQFDNHQETSKSVPSKLLPHSVYGKRSTSSIVYLDTVSVDLFCICRMPEFPGDRIVECERCHRWFHQHCLEIKNEVFDLVDASCMVV